MIKLNKTTKNNKIFMYILTLTHIFFYRNVHIFQEYIVHILDIIHTFCLIFLLLSALKNITMHANCVSTDHFLYI